MLFLAALGAACALFALAVLGAVMVLLVVFCVAAAPVRGVGLGRMLTFGLVFGPGFSLLALLGVHVVDVDGVGALVGGFLGGFALDVFHLVELCLLPGGIAHGQFFVGL